jgi:hypothetical protein
MGEPEQTDEELDKKTTVPMTKRTRNRVNGYGKKGETWDALMNRMMDELEGKR